MNFRNLILMSILICSISFLSGLNFMEDWESGDFTTNNWTFQNNDPGNWTIYPSMGNPGSSARFGANPPLMNYEYVLISQEFDASQLTQVMLDYDIKSMFMMAGTNQMSIEVRPVGGDWTSLVTYDSAIPAVGDWQHDEFDISQYAAGTNFQIGFRTTGINSFDFMFWNIDNIHVSDGSVPAVTMPFIENWISGDFAANNWTFDPEQGNWAIGVLSNDYFNIAEFGFGDQLDYSYALVSPQIDATNSSTITLDYELFAQHYDVTGLEHFAVEVFDCTNWIEIANYDNSNSGFDWIQESFDITNLVAGQVFQVRFRAYGADAFSIDWWWLDNILINDGSALPSAGVYGHVINSDDMSAITDAVVQIDGIGQITSNEGGFGSSDYGFDFDDVGPGNYELMVTAPGFQPASELIVLSNGDDLEFSFFLNPIIDNPAPSFLNANVISLDEVELNWPQCEDDPTVEFCYDDSVAEEFLNFQSTTTSQIVASRFIPDQPLNLKYLSYFIDFGTSIPAADDAVMKCYLVGDNIGQPDLNNIIAGPVEIVNLPNDPASDPVWIDVPVNALLNNGQVVYACLEWCQDDISADYFDLGCDTSDPDGMSFVTFDDGNNWQPFNGTDAKDAMIRLGTHCNNPVVLGYNLYRNNSLVNSTPLPVCSYLDSGLAQGIYSYQSSTVYPDGESALTDSVTVEVGYLNPPEITFASLLLEPELHIRISWSDPFESRDLLGFNIFRDGIQLNSQIISGFPNMYEDFDLTNIETYQYTVQSVFDEGVSALSDPAEVLVLFPPENAYGLPVDDHAELYWSEPQLPAGADLVGYNVYRWDELQNPTPITETQYIDTNVQIGEEFGYNIKAVYQQGESINSSSVYIVIGEDVMPPAANLCADVENQNVHLAWDRPVDTGDWFSWDDISIGGAFGDNGDTFLAAVKYDEWDLIDFNSHQIALIGFYPLEDADYTVKIWTNDPFMPGQWMLNEEQILDSVVPGEWNYVDIFDIFNMQSSSQFIIGIECSNYTSAPLAYDEGPAANDKADLIGEIDNWQHLSTDYNIDANWKIRAFFEYLQPFDRTKDNLLYGDYIVDSYNIYRDGILVAEIPEIESEYIDENLQAGSYTYSITTVYEVMNAAYLESEATDPVQVEIIEQLLPPANLQIDETTAHLTWNEPSLSRSSRNERELENYNIYLDDVMVGTTSENYWYFYDLISGTNYTAGIEAVYTSGISPMVTIDFVYNGTGNDDLINIKTELKGNYPNPFNPTTNINFSLSAEQKIVLEIYDIRGKKVSTLLQDNLEAGNHSVIWNGYDSNNKKVASGIYFYKMKTLNYTSTKKMILLK
ncbi:MAG: T9SS type A sorting domain-containing protein [Candidatus Cloacimonetes bacterium]|nr:T9SS type A sorting domain-containing protein [Candidatus Cloacimonadota bacterium]MCF7814044.1 T9SS type A sorting domain-containing protein [Candidatus Cloacimonadota bacterium]MCF7868654.1 T9SS type A sorting domain-containing protein [Candidatus Cloacimonadota bacterium]MCF7884109.1 T9SS type A sorting domain-containing protein [Candidatus Cloacimonadota bacterium]